MTTQLAKWGNSLAVRIPKTVAESARLKEGDQLALAVHKNGSLVVRRTRRPTRRRPNRRKYSLDELVAGITVANRHHETDWGEPVGNEASAPARGVPGGGGASAVSAEGIKVALEISLSRSIV